MSARARTHTKGMSVTLHTNLGDVKIELYVDEAPLACSALFFWWGWSGNHRANPRAAPLAVDVANFLALCASGVYDNTKFHRNIPGFMIQGGDPTGTGKGGESIWGGSFTDEFHPGANHSERGMVSMANKGPHTNKSQFFITYAPAPHLDNVYTCFGHVIHGMDALERMEKEPVSDKNRPVNPIVLQSVTIHANPIAQLRPVVDPLQPATPPGAGAS